MAVGPGIFEHQVPRFAGTDLSGHVLVGDITETVQDMDSAARAEKKLRVRNCAGMFPAGKFCAASDLL